MRTGKVPDVVTVNCEGCEYEVLSRMAQMGWLGRVPFVQFSWLIVGGVYDRLAQRCAIEQVLWDSYNPVYHALYGWQGWRLKSSYSFLQEDETQDTMAIGDDSSDEEDDVRLPFSDGEDADKSDEQGATQDASVEDG